MAERKSLIDGFREVLVEIGRENNDVVVLTGDLAKSTGVDKFQELFPERFFNLGVAEEDMLSTAAGLAGSGADGKPVFATTFAAFGASLGFGQIVQSICGNNAPVKMVFTHFGVNVGADGGSHQSTISLAMMRVLPKMSIAIPADYYETKAAIKESLRVPGPVCVFLPREAGEVVYDSNIDFQFGKSKAHRFGEQPKILFIACGLMVVEAIKVAETLLREKGLATLVLNASSIKPFDLKRVLELSREVKHIFTIEEQSILGGLGGIVCEIFGEEKEHPPITRLGIPDEFGQSGRARELWDYFGISSDKITETVLRKFK